MPETLILVHTQGCTYSFEPCQQDTPSICKSTYGGPLSLHLTGVAAGPAPLHHIATLSAVQLPMLGSTSLPLLYGFQYSGCEMRYQYSTQAVDVQSLDPSESTEDWPYENYPAQLPRLALQLTQTQAESWQEFSVRYPNLAAQQPADLVAIIPPALTIGQSLWGEDGDAEEVCVVCECDLSQQTVHSYNICS